MPAGARLVRELSQGVYQHGPAQHPTDWAVFGSTHHGSAGSTPVTVELDDGQSTLTLATFTVDEDAFFEPPG